MSGFLNTFGSGKVAETLINKLGNDKKAISRVSVFYSHYNTTLNIFEEVASTRGHFYKNLLHLYVNDRILRSYDIISDAQGGSYLRNLMMRKYKKMVAILEEIIIIERKLYKARDRK
jgi:hypothetical protein